MLLLLPAVWGQDKPASESALMAIYTYNFAKFTDFPDSSLTSPDDPINLCILGENPFGISLSSIEGKSVRQHPLQIKHYPRVAVLTGCHIVFISQSEDWRLDTILRDLDRQPILTVSAIENFARRGGMIALHTVAQKLRFTINTHAAARAGLRFSSKLLELAQIVD